MREKEYRIVPSLVSTCMNLPVDVCFLPVDDAPFTDKIENLYNYTSYNYTL